MEKRDYTVSDIYQGGYSTFKPAQTSSYFETGKFGIVTDPRTANVVQEVSTKLSAGVKNIEVEGVSPEIFDSIPKQHMKEVNRLSKLTGTNISIHAPVINVSGIDTRSGAYSEAERENAQRKVADALQRSHELDPQGNIPVNFHSAEGIPGSQMLPPGKREEGKEYKLLLVANKETGRIAPLEEERRFYPDMKRLKPGVAEKIEAGELSPVEVIGKEKYYKEIPLEKGELMTPEQRMGILNRTEWDNSISQLIFNKERADEILEKNRVLIQHITPDLEAGRISKEVLEKFPEQYNAYMHYKNAKAYLDDLYTNVAAIFSKAYKYGDDSQKKMLKQVSDQFKQVLKKDESIFNQSKAMGELIHTLKSDILTPKIYVPLEEFAVEKTSKTFGNAAFDTYQKFKKKGEPAPILSIENPPAGFALSTGEDIKRLVEASREEFVKKAVKEGLGEGEAKREAEKMIGATLDLGHMNMLRKYGYTEEEIVKEAKEMAPFLKHLHLSDNFGFEHTELPMGMGTVPTKEIMQKIEAKIGKKKTQEMRKIIEAAAWWQHMKTPPFGPTLELTGSPVYRVGAPYWSQIPGFYQDYLSGFGQVLPPINYETFGAGFSQLPSDLGGQRPGAQGGRMSGRPME